MTHPPAPDNQVDPMTPDTSPRAAVMTEKHVAALEGFGGTLCTADHRCPLPHDEVNEISSLVRELAAGNLKTFDPRERVDVPRGDVEHFSDCIIFDSEGARHNYIVGVRDALRSWLSQSTPAAASTKEERCPYGCPPERASACCEACWPAASTPTGESK